MVEAIAAGVDADRSPSVRTVVATGWREVGGLGRLAAIGVALSALVAVGLGVWIPASVRHHLLDVRMEAIDSVVDDLAREGLIPLGPGATSSATSVARAVERRLIGGEIVAVVIRDRAGTVVHGAPTSPLPDRIGYPHVEQHEDGLLHFILPVDDVDGSRIGTFEVVQEAHSFEAVLARVTRNVWLSIGSGLGALAVAMGAFTLTNARVLDGRRRHAEGLLRDLLRVEDDGRRRIVGSLHDGIGQPLYRLMYGLEGCRARLGGATEVVAELDRLISLVHDVDDTLRAELRHLCRPDVDSLDTASALEALAQGCREELGLRADVVVALRREPPALVRSVLLRAVQEGLVNVRRHAHATAVTIRAEGDGHRIAIEILDDGTGPAGPRGLGLTTMAERLASLGGGLAFSHGPTGGALLRLWAPVVGEERDAAAAG